MTVTPLGDVGRMHSASGTCRGEILAVGALSTPRDTQTAAKTTVGVTENAQGKNLLLASSLSLIDYYIPIKPHSFSQ